MSIDSDMYFNLLNRVDKLVAEVHRVQRALVSVSNGKTVEEAFDEDLYLDSDLSDARFVVGSIHKLIEYIIKLKYKVLSDQERKKLDEETINFKRNIRNYTDWNRSIRDETIIKLVNERIQDVYDMELKFLVDDLNMFPAEFKVNINQVDTLPKEIPWTLEDFAEKYSDELLKKLPNVDEHIKEEE